jgi:hypothetical protein
MPPEGCRGHKYLSKNVFSPTRQRQVFEHVLQVLEMLELRAYRVLVQSPSTQRYLVRLADDEVKLTEFSITLASQCCRHGYR